MLLFDRFSSIVKTDSPFGTVVKSLLLQSAITPYDSKLFLGVEQEHDGGQSLASEKL